MRFLMKTINQQNDKLDFIKIKCAFSSKDIVKKMKRKATIGK